MPETNIAMFIRENFIEKIEAMRAAGGRFSKELDEIEARARAYGTRMDKLSEQQASMNSQLVDAQQALSAVTKTYKKSNDEADRTAMEKAKADVNDLKAALSLLNSATRDTQSGFSQLRKELEDVEKAGSEAAEAVEESARDMSESFNRTENNLYGGGSADGASAASVLAKSMSAMWKAGLGNMLGGAVSEFAGAQIGSLVDQETGTYASGIMGGLASGAAIGSIISPLWGTLVGAVVGGVSGLVKSATEVFEQRDDAFQSYVQEQYDTLTGTMQDSLDAGIMVAGSREQTRLAFEQRFGSSQAAEEYLARVQDFAQDTNYSYDEIVGYSKLLLNSYDPEQVFSVLERLSDASAALDLENSDVTTLISGLSRMRTTGKTTQEYLNFFRERGIAVDDALSLYTGADESEIEDMVR